MTATVYEVTFTNAINGRGFTQKYDNRAAAEEAARTEWPFNNTRTAVSEVVHVPREFVAEHTAATCPTCGDRRDHTAWRTVMAAWTAANPRRRAVSFRCGKDGEIWLTVEDVEPCLES